MDEHSFGKKNKTRLSVAELYTSDVEEIAGLILKSAKSYVEVEGMSFDAARECSLSDFTFWFNNDPDRKSALEKIIYSE